MHCSRYGQHWTTTISETIENLFIVDQEDSDTETYLENEMAAFHAIQA